MKNEEYGSDFHFIDFPADNPDSSIQKIYPDSNLFFSGRVALFNLVLSGIKMFNWQAIFLPEYYCHDVDDFIKKLPINIFYYNDGPYNKSEMALPEMDKKTNAVIHVNYFGFNTCSRLNFKNAFVIEDHTHDLNSEWALNSTADYCFASLRKSMPVPAGGIIWSPKNFELPVPPAENELSNMAAYMKLSAMLLKKNYLEHGNVDKKDFRTLFINSETLFEREKTNATLPAFINTIINKVPLQLLREIKIANYKILCKAIKNKSIIWQSDTFENNCPFGLVLYLSNEEERNAMKNYLIENKIYPAVLWPHQNTPEAKNYSAKNLFIHCDIRYNSTDMQRVAETINNYMYED